MNRIRILVNRIYLWIIAPPIFAYQYLKVFISTYKRRANRIREELNQDIKIR